MPVSVEFLRRLAAAAAAETLPRFRRPGEVTNKAAAGFDPVTQADRAAEQAIRALIRAEYPGHGIHGEEFGIENPQSPQRWVVDPIDGTRAFICGLPLWGTLVGFTEDGNAVAGMMSQPFTGELFYAAGSGARYEGRDGARALRAGAVTELAAAVMCTTSPTMFPAPERAAFDRLEQAVRLSRYGTDCYAYAMLAAGNVDLVVEAGLKPYDIVALVPLVRQAGAVITTWEGGPAEQAGRIVAAATPQLHAQALDLLNA